MSAPSRARKYLIFQPDLGGWNNIRMALEIAILLAKVSGRILVLSPPAVLYLLAMYVLIDLLSSIYVSPFTFDFHIKCLFLCTKTKNVLS